ncbi:recombinase family protein [Metabacillus fastidiosus]|uniref:recombinase family protein n=1 Tax=Metabacillus fastidiosus TaxID=1458 RepID=UPI00399CF250
MSLPPLGYDLVEGELVINEQEAEIVRKIFNFYLSGKGMCKIASELNTAGYHV